MDKIGEKALKQVELAEAQKIQDEIGQLEEAIEDLETRATKKRSEVKKLKEGEDFRTEDQMQDLEREIRALGILEAKFKKTESEKDD